MQSACEVQSHVAKGGIKVMSSSLLVVPMLPKAITNPSCAWLKQLCQTQGGILRLARCASLAAQVWPASKFAFPATSTSSDLERALFW
jgi:hypothetical protein